MLQRVDADHMRVERGIIDAAAPRLLDAADGHEAAARMDVLTLRARRSTAR
jgi:hypothetical protein